MRILIIAPYPPRQAPNQRFRFEQYLNILEQNNITYDYHPFWSEKVWKIFYEPGHFALKTRGLFGGIGRRLQLLTRLKTYDYVFVHRECMPIGPPIMEWLITRVFKKKIIYDFDDAIWIRNYSSANRLARWLKFHKKVGAICGYAYKVVTGNHFLANYARQFNTHVEVIPTTIDTDRHHNRIKPVQNAKPLTIGWTGTHSTLIQIRQIEKQLEKLQKKIPFNLHVICNEDPGFLSLKYKYITWKEDSEIDDLLAFDIGVMPLRNTDWERGKCGFKALQYMALGIPVVASAVGANNDIVTDEHDGLLVSPDQPDQWMVALTRLLNSTELRAKLGAEGRNTVVNRFSVISNQEKYIRLFSDYA